MPKSLCRNVTHRVLDPSFHTDSFPHCAASQTCLRLTASWGVYPSQPALTSFSFCPKCHTSELAISAATVSLKRLSIVLVGQRKFRFNMSFAEQHIYAYEFILHVKETVVNLLSSPDVGLFQRHIALPKALEASEIVQYCSKTGSQTSTPSASRHGVH